jgi:SAM-dependent methyltransferase
VQSRPSNTGPRAGEAELAEKWRGARGGEDWRSRRWGGRARAARDPAAVVHLLARGAGHGVRVLDAACGTGRLRAALLDAGHTWCGLDVSFDQLAAGSGPRVLASALRMPLRDASVDAVVACRFLHHLADEALFTAAVRELVRVARTFVVASYWDRATWPYLLRRGPRDRSGRVARSEAEVRAAFAEAGAPVVCVHRPVWRWSAQTFVLAERSDRRA